MWDGHDGMGWWMLWGSFLWVLFVLGVAFLAAWAVRQGDHARGRSDIQSLRETPLDIARRRFAAGELSREEFEQMRRDLG